MSSPSLANVDYQGSSVLQHALDEYLQSLNAKEKEKNFFALHCDPAKPSDPKEINEKLQATLVNGRKEHSISRAVLQKLASIHKDYDSAVTNVIKSDPTPISGIIWSCVGILATIVDRYYQLRRTVDEALGKIGDDLHKIHVYGCLFGQSPQLKKLLRKSYVDIFRFWDRVYQELYRRSKVMKVMSALVSLHSDELASAVQKMRSNATNVDDAIKLAKEQDAAHEKSVHTIRDLLKLDESLTMGFTSLNDGRLPGSAYANINDRSCDWIFSNPTYQAWRKGDTPSPALWVYGPPGSGKSTLCRKVVRTLKEESSVAIASHYFRFDQNYATLDVLKSLSVQLFESYLSEHPSYDSHIEKLAKLAAERKKDVEMRVLSILRELALHLTAVHFFLDGVDEEFAKISDPSRGRGVGGATKNALDVVGVLGNFVAPTGEGRGTVRLWISSQNIPYTQENFKSYTPFDIKDAVKAGIRDYLTRSVENFEFIPPDRRNAILHRLLDRVESNFLWAHLIIVELGTAINLRALEEVLSEEGQAKNLDEYYRRLLNRLLHGSKEFVELARDVFSLVTFARRPLKVGEIWEAVTILRSSSGRLEEAGKPFSLLQVLSPLIEVQDDRSHPMGNGSDLVAHNDKDARTKTCRLYHSTVFNYLRQNAEVICDPEDNSEDGNYQPPEATFRVCPLRVADACLRYLTQVRYSKLLRHQRNDWVDADGQSVAEHLFLTYSAKNWVNHVDLIGPHGNHPSFSLEPSDGAITRVAKQFNERVQDFLTSSNFQTCIQVQSLYIVGAFSRYWWVNSNDRKVVWFRRCLPRLILKDTYHRDYQRFWWDWRKFLACTAECDDDSCPFRKCGRGEVDRCWWGALGPDNFLSTMENRYRSFRLEVPGVQAETRASSRCFFQTTLPTHDGVITLRLASISEDGQLQFVIQTWSYDADSLPRLLGPPRTVQVPIDACKASLYAVGDPKEAVSYSICAHGGGAPIAAFNSNGSCLRIGTQLYYAVGGIGEYTSFDGMDSEDLGYIEEIAGLNGVIAVASRRSNVARAADECTRASREGDDGDSDCVRSDDESVVSDSRADQGYEHDDDGDDDGDGDGNYARSDEQSVVSDSRADQGYERDDGDSDRDYTQSDDGVSDSSEYSDQGYETYSSCSSADDPEGLVDKSDSEYTRSSVRSEDEDEDEDGDEDGAMDASDDAREDDYGSDGYANSDSDDGVDPSAFAYGQMPAYGDQGVARRRRRRGAKPPLSSEIQRAIVQVFGPEGRLFRCRTRITYPLSDSPPVFHPHIPLLVWPLGGRTILFADYEDNTYFEREVGRTSSTGKCVLARTLCVRCYFATSGGYLHLAVFEGRLDDTPKGEGIPITLLIYTYRLCSKKPTRSPPTHMQSFEVDLGVFDLSQFSQRLPCTLTWTDSHLHVCLSGWTLSVYRIALFRQSDGQALAVETGVQCLQETIPLPSSAAHRHTFFLPAQTSAFAKVVVGGPILREKTPKPMSMVPIGCLLHSKDDLGQWGEPENAGERRQGRRETGRLHLPLEQFNPDVDCVRKYTRHSAAR
ncbi:hypothetical protein C8Q74DRAFT_1442530 [Fomes fomentarius]|nr:hypothetical protein C8Q74DRAFT_1442530 [Fomes fomentarius]